MSRRDLFFFSLYFSSPLSFIFFYFLFFFSLLLASLSRSRERRDYEQTRDNRESLLRVRFTSAPLPFSSPARGMSLSLSSALVRFTVPLPIFFSLTLSPFLSCKRERERTSECVSLVSQIRTTVFLARTHERKLVEAETRGRKIS